ncbi:endonuclease/exonuclease/phosphatase family protein [Paraglaciecola sp.]|uniref:endonuclease/exonuclease/phosphatase family protein n=1 Tax=Paraglaciecola sp. TaxID=1920173 RepID=UPI0032666B47
MFKLYLGLLLMLSLGGCAVTQTSSKLRVATFNVSMEATNYVEQISNIEGNELSQYLIAGNHLQIKNIAEIIQRVQPDIILLNEFDYLASSDSDIKAFLDNYLALSQNDSSPVFYPYFFAAPVNTGVDSGVDLNKDGVTSGTKDDAFGFGLYPGHYGMVVLSKYPIKKSNVRTFQKFLWKDMPDNLLDTVKYEDGTHYYSEEAQQVLRLSSKSHWDIPIEINGNELHILASHPTPPVFDGPENRNGKRNHDEIRFWRDYLSTKTESSYIYDDKGERGGFKGINFVIVGDLNASADEGDGLKRGIQGLLNHPDVNDSFTPESHAAKLHTPDSTFSASHTAFWRMRADYVLPSNSFKIIDSGVFWPDSDDLHYRLIKDRKSSSDHRLVWVDLEFM